MNNNNHQIIFLRHGQTDWNQEGRFNSFTEVPLNRIGKQDCEHISKNLKKYKINKIISSSLLRARQSSIIIAKTLKVPIFIDKRLDEMNLGVFEGKTKNDLLYGELSTVFNSWTNNEKEILHESIETYSQLESRVSNFFNEIKSKSENILVVSHAITLRTLLCFSILEVKTANYRKLRIDNAKLTIVELDDINFPRLVKLNSEN